MPQKQPKRKRMWLTDGSCIRLRPERKNHVRSYEVALKVTIYSPVLRILAIIDEYIREYLFIHSKYHTTTTVIESLYTVLVTQVIRMLFILTNSLDVLLDLESVSIFLISSMKIYAG